MRSRTVSLGGLLLLFVASRLLYLVLIDPDYLLYSAIEEVVRGTIAREVATGLKLPFLDYRADYYSGGSLVIGVLAAGFFLLFGPTLFALKLAPLLVFTLALAFWYWTIQRATDERVAGVFAIIFCFSPPLFTDYSLTAMGFHSESILFSGLSVFLLFRMLSDETASLAYPALLGLTAGFGLWFTYIYGLTLLAMLVFWFWQDRGMLRRWHVLCFTAGFGVGFSPWIILNVQNDFAGLVVNDAKLWEHFGLQNLWKGLSNPLRLVPFEFFATLASDDARGLYRRAVNVLYSLLFLGPILTAGVLRLKAVRSEQAGARPIRPKLEVFGTLYFVVFALAAQLSDFRASRYYLPAYPFLFFFLAHAIVRCQDTFPLAQRKVQALFLAGLVVLGLGAHAPLLSLDRPGYALTHKGYSYGLLDLSYSCRGSPRRCEDEVIPRLEQIPILPKLAPEDRQEFSRQIANVLARVAPLNGRASEFARVERLIPPGFEKHFYYQLGVKAMDLHPNELPKAVAAVDLLRHRSAAAHHLALVGIYRQWPEVAPLDMPLESLMTLPPEVPPAVQPHYWRGSGILAGRYWYDKDRSLGHFSADVQAFVPRLDPSVQRYFLHGVGRFLMIVPPTEIERFPQAYHQGLFEGLGIELAEFERFSPIPWKGHESPTWRARTKGLSEWSIAYLEQGRAEFDALFDGPASDAPEPPRGTR